MTYHDVSNAETRLIQAGEEWVEQHHDEIVALDEDEIEPRVLAKIRDELTGLALQLLPRERVTFVVNDVVGDLRQQVTSLRAHKPTLEPVESLCRGAQMPDRREPSISERVISSGRGTSALR